LREGSQPREEHTDPEGRKMLKESGRFAAVGLEMGLAVIIGILVGRWLDSKFGTEPWLFRVGLFAGLGAAAKAVYDVWARARREMKDDGSEAPDQD